MLQNKFQTAASQLIFLSDEMYHLKLIGSSHFYKHLIDLILIIELIDTSVIVMSKKSNFHCLLYCGMTLRSVIKPHKNPYYVCSG